MPGIDESKTFIAVNIAILTVSDSRQASDDRSGDILVDRLTGAGHNLADRTIVRDEILARLGLSADTPQLVHGFARPNHSLRAAEVSGTHDRELRVEATGRLRVVSPICAAVSYARIAGPGQTVTTGTEELPNMSAATGRTAIRDAFFGSTTELEQYQLLTDLYLGKSKVRQDRNMRADASHRQLCGRVPTPSQHGPFKL